MIHTTPTPWDGMTKEELLKEVWRMYLAAHSAFYLLRMGKNHGLYLQPHDFSHRTSVGATYETVRQVIEPLIQTDDGGEAPHDLFLTRYAADLLIQPNGFNMIGHGWRVCPKCGRGIGQSMNHDMSPRPVEPGTRCIDAHGEHEDVLVPLTWALLGRPELDPVPVPA